MTETAAHGRATANGREKRVDSDARRRWRTTSCWARSCSRSAWPASSSTGSNVIILLMAIELMLLAVNLNFIAFSRYLGDMAGQVFVFFILTVAAAESAIGLAILVLLFRNVGSIDVEDIGNAQGLSAMDMQTLYLARAARAARRRRSSSGCSGRSSAARSSHWLCILGVAVAMVASYRRSGATCAPATCSTATSTRGCSRATSSSSIGFLIDPLTATMMLVVDVRVADGAHLHDRLHGRRPGYTRFFSLHLALHVLDADARDEQQLPAAVLRLGGGGPRVVPADRLLVHAADGDLREPEGVPRQPRRRLRLRAGHRSRARATSARSTTRRCSPQAPTLAGDDDQPRGAARSGRC